ncbi:MAG TPA: O-antigen polymerase [Candidatus Kryptonia bacterium]
MTEALGLLWDYIPVPILALDFILMILLYRRMKDRFVLRPIFIIPLILLIYPILGTLNLALVQSLAGFYVAINPYNANRLVFLSLGALILSLIFYKSEAAPKPAIVRFDGTSLIIWIIWGTAIGTVFNAVNFYAIGGIPIFWSNLTGNERFEVAGLLPFAKFLAFSSALLTLNFIYLIRGYKPRLINIACMIVNVIISVGIGSRHLVFLPLVMAGIYFMLLKRISSRVVLYSLIGVAFLSFFFEVLRGQTTIAGSTSDVASSPAANTLGFLYSMGGEYRDFVLLRNSYHYTDFLYGQTILPIFTNIIPKQVFELFGMDKAAYSVYSAYVAQNIWGADTGIRVGIWGEFYMNWGDIGLFLGFIVYGFLLRLLDKKILSDLASEPKMLFYAFIFTLFFFSIIGAWATLGDTIEVWGVIYFLVSRFVRRESYEMTTNVPQPVQA